MSKIINYFKDTKTELKHVNWPSRQQTLVYTVIVVVMSGLVGYMLGFFDFVFSLGLEKLLTF